MSAVEQFQRLIETGQPSEAVAVLQRAADAGDSSSALALGLEYLAGKHINRDLIRAREFVGRSAEAGDLTARNIYLQFLGLGVGGEADWKNAVLQLRDLARTNRVAAQQLGLLDHMELAADGSPARQFNPRPLSNDPEVTAFEEFFSPGECAYLIARSRPLLRPSTIVDPGSGRLIPHPVRTSHSIAYPWVAEDLVIQALNRRIASVSGTFSEAGEPLQVLRYEPGQEYRPHFDAYDNTDNQRVFTFLAYLNDDYLGGQTVFTHNGLTFRGRTGDGLLFRNATSSGQRDEHAQHASLPVSQGEKWLASRWIRQRPLVEL